MKIHFLGWKWWSRFRFSGFFCWMFLWLCSSLPSCYHIWTRIFLLPLSTRKKQTLQSEKPFNPWLMVCIFREYFNIVPLYYIWGYLILYLILITQPPINIVPDVIPRRGSHGTDYNRHSRNLLSLYYQGSTGTVTQPHEFRLVWQIRSRVHCLLVQ